MSRESRTKISLVLMLTASICVALLLAAGPGNATARTPSNFYGVVLADTPSPKDWDTMQRSGVGSVRLAINWDVIQPHGRGPFDWSSTDEIVGSAAAHGIEVLPFLVGTPLPLAPSSITLPIRTARQRNGWADFLRALASRYGPGGSFWQDHPYAEYQPIRDWQIWNEQNTQFFANPASPRAYDRLLQLSANALRSVDAKAGVIIGGMLGRPAAKPPVAWRADDFVDRMYKAGPIRRYFTGVGLHPYSEKISQVGIQAKDMRRVLAGHNDGGKSLAITEITWGSGPPGSGWLEEGPGGQARRLTQVYRLFRANRAAWRVRGVYWFSWRSHASVPECVFCRTSGLLNLKGNETPALRAFRSLAG
jgi:hypothetical protein